MNLLTGASLLALAKSIYYANESIFPGNTFTEYLKGQIPGIFNLEDIRLLFPTKTDIVSCDKMTISNQNKA